jgi:hypothetical protein
LAPRNALLVRRSRPHRSGAGCVLIIAIIGVADTELLIEKLKLQLPSQPPPRLVAQKQSYEIEVGGYFVVRTFP